MRGEFVNPPDVVAHPRNENELEATLEWCDGQGYTAIPYGGGTSVVWGVNVPDGCDGAVTIDLDNLNAVLEVDEVSRVGRFHAGLWQYRVTWCEKHHARAWTRNVRPRVAGRSCSTHRPAI